MNKRNISYPYSDREANVEAGWNFDLDDVVPADVRAAEQDRRDAYADHDAALSDVGRLDAEIKAAKVKDQIALAQALADRKPAPDQSNIAELEQQLADARRLVEATRNAKQIVGQRFKVAATAADLQPAVVQYNNQCTAAVARCRDLLAQARAARDEALEARRISRTLDAFPMSPSNARQDGVITDASAWTEGVDRIEGDLETIADSIPVSLHDGLSERERNAG